MTTKKSSSKKPVAKKTVTKKTPEKKTNSKKDSVKITKKRTQETISMDKHLYPILGVVIGVILVFLLAVSAWNLHKINENNEDVEDLTGRVSTLEDKMDAVYDSLNNYPSLAPKPIRLDIEKPVTSENWKGQNDVRFVWITYSDLQCPYCAKINPDLKTLQEKNPDDVALVFRHLPFDQLHEGSTKLAEAAQCVAKTQGQDAFWKFVDDAFLGNINVTLENLPDYVDGAQMNDCLEKGLTTDIVNKHAQEAASVSIQSTPTNVIYDLENGKTKVIEGALAYPDLEKALKDFIAKETE